jgi:hypothetical protein
MLTLTTEGGLEVQLPVSSIFRIVRMKGGSLVSLHKPPERVVTVVVLEYPDEIEAKIQAAGR